MSTTVTAVEKSVKTTKAAGTKRVAKPKMQSVFVLSEIARPVSGGRLYAHTFAAFTLLGMLKEGHKAPVASLQKIVGPRAIKYHSKEKHNLALDGESVSLTADGAQFFAARFRDGRCRQEDATKFLSVLKTGVEDASIGVKASHIVPMQMQF